MSIQRRLRRIGSFFRLTSADVPSELISTPIQSTFEVGPHNYIDWITFSEIQALTPSGIHILIDADLDDTEQYCYQLNGLNWTYAAGTNAINFFVFTSNVQAGTVVQATFTQTPVGSAFPDRAAGNVDNGAANTFPTNMGGFIVPPGHSLKMSWDDAGVGGSGRIAYVLLKYPWGSRPLVLSR